MKDSKFVPKYLVGINRQTFSWVQLLHKVSAGRKNKDPAHWVWPLHFFNNIWTFFSGIRKHLEREGERKKPKTLTRGAERADRHRRTTCQQELAPRNVHKHTAPLCYPQSLSGVICERIFLSVSVCCNLQTFVSEVTIENFHCWVKTELIYWIYSCVNKNGLTFGRSGVCCQQMWNQMKPLWSLGTKSYCCVRMQAWSCIYQLVITNNVTKVLLKQQPQPLPSS